ncbi:SafA/ExsA family spore coat assembly protein [Bacillus aerolatus]|uniref:SafA/ExsA family spore coat assembly protein n=1 Tax=Bacillus aerolatus TaxID=2653354 RepID=A0A6I1FIZ0_9BACI|nr:SafA/ExsA family spore coat assembly protein [Bacillus aerolatus]KAB7708638.1 SafA/ExsA family spore coat assembly protein [Bacillus aerolatus]
MRIHIVQKGDTLWTIAKKYGVNFDELKKMNAQLSNPDLIMPGMKIKVPAPAGTPKKEMPKPQKEAPVAPPPAPVKEQVKEQVQPAPPVKEQVQPAPPVKQQPKMPAMPPLPPIIPEVEINQIFQMNMEQMQQTVQPQAPAKPDNIFPGLGKKEEVMESPSLPIAPPVMPEMEIAPKLQGGCTYQMNPHANMYQMAPQVQGHGMHHGLQPHWCMPAPIHTAPPMQCPYGIAGENIMPPPYGMAGENMMPSPHGMAGENMMHPPYEMAGENMMPPPHGMAGENMMHPLYETAEENMMESLDVSPNYPMMNYPSPDQVQGVQDEMSFMPMPYAPQMYPAPPYQMPNYPPYGQCIPMTPVMPGMGYHSPYGAMPYQPMGYGMESPEYSSPSHVMGAYQPQAHYPQPVMQQPYMHGYHQQPMHPSMGMPHHQHPKKLDCGCQRLDEEDEE